MKAHLQEAFAQDNREEYLKYRERINAKNKEKILAKRKAIASKASVEELVVTPPPNLPSLVRPQHSVLLYTQNQDT